MDEVSLHSPAVSMSASSPVGVARFLSEGEVLEDKLPLVSMPPGTDSAKGLHPHIFAHSS